MKALFLSILFIIAGCNKSTSSKKCEEVKYCSDFEASFKNCLRSDRGETECNEFIGLFKLLTQKKDCHYDDSDSLETISAIWKCDEGRKYHDQVFVKACMLLDDLIVKNKNAKDFYISTQFQNVLSGESAEAFKAKSEAMGDLYAKKVMSGKELFTVENNNYLLDLTAKQFLDEKGWKLLLNYLTVKQPRYIPAQAIPNYDNVAKVIVNNGDQFLMKLYFEFILATQNSADEMRSYGLARIYDSLSLKFLDILSSFEPSARKNLTESLVWGIVNTKRINVPKMTIAKLKTNFPRNKEVYKANYKHSLLVTNILEEVLKIVKK